jgi:PTS system nitrogen regulatory IIA component
MWTHASAVRQHQGISARLRAWGAVEKESALNTIASLLRVEDIHLDLAVSNKNGLFDAIGQRLEASRRLPYEFVTSGLQRREAVGSTALGQGVAIPHARVKNLEEIVVSYVRLSSPILFDAPDQQPVSDILVLLVPKQATEEHLRILAEATQLFAARDFRLRLGACRTSEEVKALFDSQRI